MKFLVAFGKVIRALIVKTPEGQEEVFIITRSARTPEEKRIHQRHPVIGLPRYSLD